MMRHFDMKRYPRERGKNLYTILGGRLFKGGEGMYAFDCIIVVKPGDKSSSKIF